MELNQTVVALSEKMRAAMTVSKEGVSEVPAALTADYLKEKGVDTSQIELYHSAISELAAAGIDAHGRTALPVFEANPELKAAKLQLPLVGKDVLNINLKRSQTVPAGNGETKLAYGTSTVSIDSYSVGNHGQLAAAKRAVSDLFAGAFDK